MLSGADIDGLLRRMLCNKVVSELFHTWSRYSRGSICVARRAAGSCRQCHLLVALSSFDSLSALHATPQGQSGSGNHRLLSWSQIRTVTKQALGRTAID